MVEFKPGDQVRILIGDKNDKKSFTTITIKEVKGTRMRFTMLDPMTGDKWDEEDDISSFRLYDEKKAYGSLKDRVYLFLGVPRWKLRP